MVEVAYDPQIGAQAGGLKMIEPPAIVGEKTQLRGDALDGERTRRRGRDSNRHEQAALAKIEGLHAEVKARQFPIIELDDGLLDR